MEKIFGIDHQCNVNFHSRIQLGIMGLNREIRRWAMRWKNDNIPSGEQDKNGMGAYEMNAEKIEVKQP